MTQTEQTTKRGKNVPNVTFARPSRQSLSCASQQQPSSVPCLAFVHSSSRTTLYINLLFLSSRLNPVTVAKTAAYKKIRLACCFDCGRSERDCSCMPANVRCNMDSPQRDIPLSAVSVNDCSATLRACKLSPWHVLFSVCNMHCVHRAACLCLALAAVSSLSWI